MKFHVMKFHSKFDNPETSKKFHKSFFSSNSENWNIRTVRQREIRALDQPHLVIFSLQ